MKAGASFIKSWQGVSEQSVSFKEVHFYRLTSLKVVFFCFFLTAQSYSQASFSNTIYLWIWIIW